MADAGRKAAIAPRQMTAPHGMAFSGMSGALSGQSGQWLDPVICGIGAADIACGTVVTKTRAKATTSDNRRRLS